MMYNENGDKIRVHWDGTLAADNSVGFASVQIDELIFYNKFLSNDDIEGLFAQRK